MEILLRPSKAIITIAVNTTSAVLLILSFLIIFVLKIATVVCRHEFRGHMIGSRHIHCLFTLLMYDLLATLLLKHVTFIFY